MPITIPETLSSTSGLITKGERKTFEYLKEYLPPDCIVYYNLPVGGYYPDFIILSPEIGIFVLEVKDWYLNNIKSINKETISLDCDGEIKKLENPFHQARKYILNILRLIAGNKHFKTNKRNFKWGYGVLFFNITDEEISKLSLVTNNLPEVFGSDFIFTADDLKNRTLFNKIKSKMSHHYGHIHLEKEHLDIIRSILYPELIIGSIDTDILRVLDEEQEKVAKSLGDGHYLIRGVAGSGKTVIVISRVKYLSRLFPNWKILLLCYNKTLAHYFKNVLKDYKNVETNTYHSWCLKEIFSSQQKKVAIEMKECDRSEDKFWEEVLPSKILEGYEKGALQEGKYDAIVIDEGQDFSDIWYKTILKALNKNTNSLLIALDNSQSIYNRRVSWKNIGINIVGRTRVLKVNYRNTKQILEYAYSFIKTLDENNASSVGEEDFEYIVPEKALRDGPPVEVKFFDNVKKENEFLLSWIKGKTNYSDTCEDIFVLCMTRKDAEFVFSYLKKENINVSYITSENLTKHNVYILTVHSSKGLESDNVLIYNAHNSNIFHNESEAKRLMYIAMTRAKKNLCICYAKKNRD